MDIYQTSEKSLPVVSSQGNSRFVICDITNPDLASFTASDGTAMKIVDSIVLGVDGAEDTDGLVITSVNLGGMYSAGLLVELYRLC